MNLEKNDKNDDESGRHVRTEKVWDCLLLRKEE